MSDGRSAEPRGEDELAFRTLAAPGLEEDDLFAAMQGLPGTGVLWGNGMPNAFPPPDPPWDESAARQRRHDALLRKWGPAKGWPGVT